MEEIKRLSDDVIEQIKDFEYWKLTKEQESLIDKLISDEELKRRFEDYGLCNECKQPKGYNWCQLCSAKHFQQNFKNWSSGNDDVDEFIQKAQLKVERGCDILEWIEHDKLENIEYLAKGGFGIVYKAIWKDSPIEEWDFENNQLKRKDSNHTVALKCLHNSQDIKAEFLKEVRCFFSDELTFYECKTNHHPSPLHCISD
jgi:hypothetical protein